MKHSTRLFIGSLLASSLAATSFAQTSLVAHYRLDETAGTIAADSSGNGNNGMYVGGVTLGTPGAGAGSGTSVDFDGVDGRIEIPGSATLNPLDSNLTVAAFVNADMIALMRIFGNERPNGPGTGGSWSYGINNTGIRFTTLDRQDYDQAVLWNPGQWLHVAVVFDASFTATFYLDGVNLGAIGGTQPAQMAQPRWFIGVLDLNIMSEFMDGRIDDVQIYSGSATDADIAFLAANPGQTLGVGTIGMSYCGPAIPNSSGMGAIIEATGSAAVAANNVTLTASQMPAGQFGYFLAGQTQGFFNPPGSQGLICLVGNIGRYNQIANIIQGPTGSIMIDLTAIPVNPTAAVMPGETWNFQCWFRDNNPALTNNFTDGVEILFQ
ncbi:MAG: LamG domain-containing protein [bacterium]|nr:LamG domain-containing protein [bacterium]